MEHVVECFICKQCGRKGIYSTQWRKDESSVVVSCKCGARDTVQFESPEKAKTFHRGWDSTGDEIRDQAYNLRQMMRKERSWNSERS